MHFHIETNSQNCILQKQLKCILSYVAASLTGYLDGGQLERSGTDDEAHRRMNHKAGTKAQVKTGSLKA